MWFTCRGRKKEKETNREGKKKKKIYEKTAK